MEQRKRFYVALVIYAVLGLAIWLTIDDIVIPMSSLPAVLQNVHITLRQLTLVILGMFVLRTVLHHWAEQARGQREDKESSELM
jgi:cytochrome b561